tara:strand:- start:367 stop:480 length:114 start_codon:yes stop_codon:yes gene_type:complete
MDTPSINHRIGNSAYQLGIFGQGAFHRCDLFAPKDTA